MFDVGFSEILLILVVALVVLGPERLPKAARYVGLAVRRIRAHWYSVKSELESEFADAELKRSLQETQAALRNAQQQLREQTDSLNQDLNESLADPQQSNPDQASHDR